MATLLETANEKLNPRNLSIVLGINLRDDQIRYKPGYEKMYANESISAVFHLIERVAP
ncbi:hypothetical protein ACQ4M3_13490 [Leptolyngbya sp. AN03gr2]|uniref:hypothetical protein n=1 Tax=unclassified Leptolyngbya TaxID=2650499 RepID=UPI003D31DEDA